MPNHSPHAPAHKIQILGFACAAFLISGVPFDASAAAPGKFFAPLGEVDESFEVPGTLFTPIPGKDPDAWSFTLEPYLWAIGISGQVGIKNLGPAHIDFSPKTVLQHLDWGVMTRGEIRKGRWGVIGDGLFAQLSASGDSPGPLYRNSSVKIQQGMASLALAYRVFEIRQGFLDIYAGARFNYMGINLGGSLDSSGIQNISDAATQRISNVLTERVNAYISANAATAASAIAENVSSSLTSKALLAATNLRSEVGQSLGARDVARIMTSLRNQNGAYRELIAATAQARLAEAKGQPTAAVQKHLENAKKKFADALADEIEKKLPLCVDGQQWWVDPIIGLRGQINIARWLFLAAQGDVGGFGAGSDIAWMVQASMGVNITRNIFAEVGYRYFYMDYANDGAVYNVGQFGVFSGIGVRF